MKMELQLLPCEPSDRGRQRCRLGPQLMDKLQLKLGSCVLLHVHNKRFLCCVWPRKDGWEGGLQFDDSFFEEDEDSEKRSGGLNSLPISSIIPIKSNTTKTLSLTVVLKQYSDVQKWKKELGKGTGKSLLAKNILRGFFVRKDITVNTNCRLGELYGVSHIIVDHLICEQENIDCGLVTMKTDVDLVQVQSCEHYQKRKGNVKHATKLGGMEKPMAMLKEILSLPMKFPGALQRLGISCPRGILLQGPPGCGKTSLVQAVGHDLEACVLSICGAEVFGALPGEGEDTLKKLFHKASQLSLEGPTIIFIDELDALCPKKGRGQGGQERRLVALLGLLMDELSESSSNGRELMVVGATNRPNAIDPCLRRAGRFEKEIFIGVPTMSQRKNILQILTSDLTLSNDLDLIWLSEVTPGFVGADLSSLVQQAAYTAMKGHMGDGKFEVEMEHFRAALNRIVPSTQRGSDVLVDHRPLNWSQIGGLDHVKTQLKQAVEWPMRHPEAFSRLGISRPKGVLLFGPPGCAKTLLVRAAASACKATFLAVSGGQLYSPFVGDSERKIAEVFQQARAGAPSILFLDELDAVVGRRSQGGKEQGVTDRVLSTLLNEMDGVGLRLDDLKRSGEMKEPFRVKEGDGYHQNIQDSVQEKVDNLGVLVVAATNRPDCLDEAILRPGRIDRIIYVPPPDFKARLEILHVHTKNMPLQQVDLDLLAEKTENFTGADLENLCREAALHALSVDGLDAQFVSQEHFNTVLSHSKPSLTQEQIRFYASLGPAFDVKNRNS